ncbi:hypothetical protein ABE85_06240 [Mitsuaria sp. 7]|nr:hypothetical protein ABE85_06240 [Mitsuaria sp. 7]
MVLFKASGTGTVVSVEWDFGDGVKLINTTSQEASHTFLKSGDLTVTVTLVGAAGDRVAATATVKVLPSLLEVAIDQTGNPDQPLLRSARVRFAARVVTPFSDHIRAAQTPAGLRYRWTFSDGATSDASAPAHVFEAAGDHDVTLAVTDAQGRVVTAKRVVTVNGDIRPTMIQTNLGGSGASNDGAMSLLGSPDGMARDKDGSVYVLDFANTVIRKVAPNGEVSDFAGASGVPGFLDGTGGEARLGNLAHGLTIDAAGTLYFSDGGALRSVSSGGVVKTFDKAVLVDNDEAELKRNWIVDGLAAAPDGTLYFMDSSRVMKLKDGKVSVLAGSLEHTVARVDGPGAQARFGRMSAMTMRPDGKLVLLDSCYGVRTIDPDGRVGTLIPDADTSKTPNQFNACSQQGRSLAAMADGRVLMLWDSSLRVIEADGSVRTVAFPLGGEHVMAVNATTAWVSNQQRHIIEWVRLDNGSHGTQLGRPSDIGEAVPALAPTVPAYVEPWQSIAIDQNGKVLFTYFGEIHRYDAATKSSQKLAAGSGPAMLDGLPGNAQVVAAVHVATDAAGNLYFTDSYRAIRRMAASDGAIRTLSGSSTGGTADGPGVGARFEQISDMTAAADGTVYVIDKRRRLVRVRPDGETTTLLTLPEEVTTGMAVTPSGQLLVAYQGLLRRLEHDNSLTTIAGELYGTTPQLPLARRLSTSAQPLVSSSGQVYLIDWSAKQRVLRRLEADGSFVDLAQDGPLALALVDGHGPVELSFSFSRAAFMPDGRLMVWAGQPHSWWTLDGLR